MKTLIVLIALIAGGVALFWQIPCEDCGGSGNEPAPASIQVSCPRCGGSGRGEWQLQGRPRSETGKPLCQRCRGIGHLEQASTTSKPCAVCEGRGHRRLYEILLRTCGFTKDTAGARAPA